MWQSAVGKEKSVLSLIHQGELLGSVSTHFLDGHIDFAHRLQKATSLHHHTGCVNRLSFATDDRLLASASDDTTVCLWDVASQSLKTDIQTGHSLNIFGVRFMPHSGNQYVATGSMDNSVRVTNVETGKNVYLAYHQNRVKSVDVDCQAPKIILSASEDNTVCLHDLRERSPHVPPHSDQHCSSVVVRLQTPPRYNGHPGIKGAHLNPADSNKLVVAAHGALIYDRRFVGSQEHSGDSTPGCLQSLVPAHLSDAALHQYGIGRSFLQACATHAAFSQCGTRVVASFSGDHVYTFDISGSGSPKSPISSSQRMCKVLPRSKDTQFERLFRRSMETFCENLICSTLETLSQALVIAPNNVAALFLQCEAYIDRRWISDCRPALHSSRKIHEIVAADESALSKLVHASMEPVSSCPTVSRTKSCGGQYTHKEDLFRFWRIFLDFQFIICVHGVLSLQGVLLSSREATRYRTNWQDGETRSRMIELRAMLRSAVHKMKQLETKHSHSLGKSSSLAALLNVLCNGRATSLFRSLVQEDEDRLLNIRNEFRRYFHTLARTRQRPSSMPAGSSSEASRSSDLSSHHPATTSATSSGASGRLKLNSESIPERPDSEAGYPHESVNESTERSEDLESVALQSELAMLLSCPEMFEVTISQDADGEDGEDDENMTEDSSDSGEIYGDSYRTRLREIESALELSDDESCSDKRTRLSRRSVGRYDSNVLGCSFSNEMSRLGFSRRFVGHRNVMTDIKEASFYGVQNQCVLGGSDDGHLYVWCALTGRILARLRADDDIVNCVQAAPQSWGSGLVATSGIDLDVKLWTPHGDDETTGPFEDPFCMERILNDNVTLKWNTVNRLDSAFTGIVQLLRSRLADSDDDLSDLRLHI